MIDTTKSIKDRILDAHQRPGENGEGSFLTAPVSPWPRWRRRAFYCACAAVLLAGFGFGIYRAPVFAESIAQAAGKSKSGQQVENGEGKAPAAQGAAASTNAFQAHAEQMGVKACGSIYADLGKALTDGTQYMVQTQAAKSEPDRRSVEGVVGMNFPSGSGAYSGSAAGIVFAAPTAQGCEGTLVRVVPFAQTCEAAVGLLPKGSQPMQPLSGINVYALPTGGQAMLMPNANGCVAISVLRS